MAGSQRVFREYTSDDSFTKLDIPKDVPASEFQVCLAFARDYDGKNSTNGKFTPFWDTEKVTPGVITQFKKKCAAAKLPVKVVVSIGNNNKQFPFKVVGGADEWVRNASESLQRIINDFYLDGIDVHYMDINPSSQNYFVDCIGQLAQKLKGTGGSNAEVSLATNAATNDQYYVPLYQAIQQTTVSIKTVVFQCFLDFKPDSVASLVGKVKTIAAQYDSLPNFLLGYSTIREDWGIVSPPFFFLALISLLQGDGDNNPVIRGSSIKVISDSIASFPPKWIPQMLSLAAYNAGP